MVEPSAQCRLSAYSWEYSGTVIPVLPFVAHFTPRAPLIRALLILGASFSDRRAVLVAVHRVAPSHPLAIFVFASGQMSAPAKARSAETSHACVAAQKVVDPSCHLSYARAESGVRPRPRVPAHENLTGGSKQHMLRHTEAL